MYLTIRNGIIILKFVTRSKLRILYWKRIRIFEQLCLDQSNLQRRGFRIFFSFVIEFKFSVERTTTNWGHKDALGSAQFATLTAEVGRRVTVAAFTIK